MIVRKQFVQGIGLGIAAGTVIGMMMIPKRKAHTVPGKAIRAVGDVVDNVAGAFKM